MGVWTLLVPISRGHDGEAALDMLGRVGNLLGGRVTWVVIWLGTGCDKQEAEIFGAWRPWTMDMVSEPHRAKPGKHFVTVNTKTWSIILLVHV